MPVFRKSTEKYHHYFRTFSGGLVVVFFGLRRWAVVPFLPLVVVFAYFAESNCFLHSLFFSWGVSQKGSNTTTRGKIPPLNNCLLLGGLAWS